MEARGVAELPVRPVTGEHPGEEIHEIAEQGRA